MSVNEWSVKNPKLSEGDVGIDSSLGVYMVGQKENS